LVFNEHWFLRFRPHFVRAGILIEEP